MESPAIGIQQNLDSVAFGANLTPIGRFPGMSRFFLALPIYEILMTSPKPWKVHRMPAFMNSLVAPCQSTGAQTILSSGCITPAWTGCGRCGKITVIMTGFATHKTFVGDTLVATWIDPWLLSMKVDEESTSTDPVEIDHRRRVSF
jgi:hypothetical protein